MSIRLDPKEVLSYLNELGYYNITTLQLKEFMTDLKKLILYDIKKAEKENQPLNKPKTVREFFQERHIRKKNLDLCDENQRKHKVNQVKAKSTPALIKNDIFSNLHSASTVSSRARSIRPESSEDSRRIQNFYDIPNRPLDSRLFPSACTCSSSDFISEFDTNYLFVNTNPTQRIKSAGVLSQKPTSSFIRPQTAKKQYSEKSDPVALYHKYKEEWDKQKLPGEACHKNLRWSVREKMLSGPDIKVRTLQPSLPSTISTKKCRT